MTDYTQDFRKELDEYRSEIDRIDTELAALLEKRLRVVRSVGACKAAAGLPVLDAAREQEKLHALEGLCGSGAGAYVADVFREIMARSRNVQEELRTSGNDAEHGAEHGGAATEYGLLGHKLGHSYSPQIHCLIGDYAFGLFDLEPEQLDAFFQEGRFRGLTVTMPYKRTVMQYCAALSETAVKCGSVNTIVKRPDGTYYGDNTDYHGFRSTVEGSGVSIKGKKTLVLGSGGVSGTVVRVLEDLGAAPIVVISRNGPDHYENLDRHADAQIIVNTTPVGMYPNAGAAVIDIRKFPACEAVFDLIYNPLRTKLMLDAADAGIPAFGGLHMLTAQAAKAFGLFCEANPSLHAAGDLDAVTERACRQLRWETENIVLIGMPGSGKTTLGRQLAEITGKAFVDCDALITEQYSRTPEQIITEDGIQRFREIEASMINSVMRPDPGHADGIVFATGGGCVEREENRVPLLENSLVVYVGRDLADLPLEGRPVSQKDGLQAVYERRWELYERWSDVNVFLKAKGITK